MRSGDRGNFRKIIDWSLVGLIVILCAIMIWYVSARNAKYDQRADYYAANHASETDGAIERECVGADIPAIRKCIEEKVRAEQESQRAEYDLATQQAMSDWAFGVLVISFITLLATVAGVVYVRNTLLETRRLGEAQTRAYLSVADFKSRVVGAENACISVEVTFKNTGQTPARNVRTNLAWASDPPPFKEELHRTTIANSEGRGSIAAGMAFFGAIRTDRFQNDPNQSLTATQIADVVHGTSKFWLYGLLEYDDVFGHQHRTRFRYEMNVEHASNVGFSPCLVGNEED